MKVLKWLDANFERLLLAILLIIMACVMMTNIICRYVFHNAFSWAEEQSRYCLVGMAFISLGYSTKYNQLTTVDSVIKKLPVFLYKFFIIFAKVCTLAFFTYMLKYSWQTVLMIKKSKMITSSLQYPMYWVYLFMPLGFGLGIIRSIQNIIVTEIIPAIKIGKKDKEIQNVVEKEVK